ncbi:SPFH domain-containing protein [Lusitaniella coriacea LEGE 07157]|uniref:SPFH domain-containing protein n=1 Tax=Lusitaniella coriacea LEGE 07157 TaxID=945747 RepID=A0A8J7DXT7_9CYAN|nr:SPFH domain-containing protein [Lusitaniella coriacea]MBE9117351.1 SPFH domain-containing protein [Lusitaniella coriacea LEGE 07157]
MSWLQGQFIDIIEWIDNTNDTIAYRFERHNNEIKQGAKLIVRPGQQAVFVNEGQVADEFTAGTYELFTRNLPILSTLKGWKYGFESPFKAEVYFFSTRIFTNLKWGTANPIAIRDAEFGPVRIRAFGTYGIRVVNPKKLLESAIGTDGLFQVNEIDDHLRNLIVPSVTSWIAGSGIALLDFAANYRAMGDRACEGIRTDLDSLGIEITQLTIENISLPPAVEEALDKRSSMGILGNMGQYTQYQTANAIENAAKRPGGGNSAMDMGMGLAMGQQMANAMQTPVTPAPPSPAQWYIARNGEKLGPFTLEQLQQQAISPQTQVWQNGMSGWQPASTVPSLQAILLTAPPPPPMPQGQWYIAQNGEKLGPFTPEQLQQQGISLQTQVWRNGMDDWQLAATVPELSELFADTPVPPPLASVAPEPQTQAEWYIFRSGDATGPFTLEQLREQGISPRTNLRREGETEWTRARDIQDSALQSLLASLS